jgi:hypothetical protein
LKPALALPIVCSTFTVIAALAQQVPPYTYPQVIGTSSVTVLPPDPAQEGGFSQPE